MKKGAVAAVFLFFGFGLQGGLCASTPPEEEVNGKAKPPRKWRARLDKREKDFRNWLEERVKQRMDEHQHEDFNLALRDFDIKHVEARRALLRARKRLKQENKYSKKVLKRLFEKADEKMDALATGERKAFLRRRHYDDVMRGVKKEWQRREEVRRAWREEFAKQILEEVSEKVMSVSKDAHYEFKRAIADPRSYILKFFSVVGQQ